MCLAIDYVNDWSFDTYRMIFVIFQIIPRTLLVLCLLLDTFYFLRLELLYKIILLGLIPLLFRYFLYSFKDILKHWTKTLEKNINIFKFLRKGMNLIILVKERLMLNTIIKHYPSVNI